MTLKQIECYHDQCAVHGACDPVCNRKLYLRILDGKKRLKDEFF